MAQRTILTLIDDLDGGQADGTISFALEGTDYEMELSDSNRELLLKALEPFTQAARVVGRPRRPQRRSSPPSAGNALSRPERDAIRSWAKWNGVELSPRGRIPEDVVRRYQASQQ